MSDRLDKLLNQLNGLAPPSPDDIVIVNIKRTALGRARKGPFNMTNAVDLLVPVIKDVTQNIDKSLIGDVVVGTVLAAGSMRASECRIAALNAGIPETAGCRTVNRQCSSGLQAIADVAAAIRAGYYEVGVAAGVETMSHNSMSPGKNFVVSDSMKRFRSGRGCLLPMGITSENVAAKYGVTREEQDQFAMQSHQRAAKAKTKFLAEITPVSCDQRNTNTGKVERILATHDDGVRPQTTMASLSKLRPVFAKKGSTTAGNASQLTDGAAACLMMKRSKATELGLKHKARFTNFCAVGVPPHIMGVGPAYAIPVCLQQAGLKTSDIDLWEINEAFASQAVYCVKALSLSTDNVNVNGGAIALGHPLGCTGVRMAATLLYEMERRGDKRGIVSMCIGTGMGAAGLFERV